jgi:hypothetical protein
MQKKARENNNNQRVLAGKGHQEALRPDASTRSVLVLNCRVR